jgi:hypothetical protein
LVDVSLQHKSAHAARLLAADIKPAGFLMTGGDAGNGASRGSNTRKIRKPLPRVSQRKLRRVVWSA